MGSRRSLLARAQSMAFARALEAKHSGLKVEFVGIETRGDVTLDRPLSAMEGKEFFVAELDDALRSGAVDFTVHSLKDLSLERPADFALASMPTRAPAHDVLILGPQVATKAGPLKIGTSSPRRLENIPPLLAEILPASWAARGAEFVEIRGNVNTRLARVQLDPTDSRSLDGVVLAFAGLQRLAEDKDACGELRALLKDTRTIVLPLRQNPTAPGQGALAVECRRADSKTFEILRSLHDAVTEASVRSERAVLAAWGGGCHQRFGATEIARPGIAPLLWIKGARSDSTVVDEVRWKAGTPPAAGPHWDGTQQRVTRPEALTLDAAALAKITNAELIFVGHERAVTLSPEVRDALMKAEQRGARIWTAGMASWKALAQSGLSIEGSAESLGFEFVQDLMFAPLLTLLRAVHHGVVLTHDRADEFLVSGEPHTKSVINTRGRSSLETIATYRLIKDPSLVEIAQKQIAAAHSLYWSSASQFELLGQFARKDAQHACGVGKTAAYLRAQGIEPVCFPSVQEWRNASSESVSERKIP